MKKLITKRRVISFAVIAAVVIVPLMYSYFYLGAFWDPYSRLETLPVAIVNNDGGAVINDEERNLGTEMCDELTGKDDLKFTITDEATARKGTEGNDYYAMIIIPEDFSQNIASASTDDKQTATITFSANEKHNYLAGQILGRAVLEIEENLRGTVDESIVQELADNINSVPDQMTELQDGLTKLQDGATTLNDGVSSLKDGAVTLTDGTGRLCDGATALADGAIKLNDGATQLNDGASKLKDGAAALADGSATFYDKLGEYSVGISTAKEGSSSLAAGATQLDDGIKKLQEGASQVVTATAKLDQLTSGAKTLAKGTNDFNAGLLQYTAGVDTLISTVTDTQTFLTKYVTTINPSIMKDPYFSAFINKMSDPANAKSITTLQAASKSLKEASAQISAGTTLLSAGTESLPQLQSALATLSAGITKAKEGSAALSAGSNDLYAGLIKIDSATVQLSEGARNIAVGAATLSDGSSKLSNGTSDLSNGTASLSEGATTLSEGAATLNDGAIKLSDGTAKLSDGSIKLSEGITSAKTGVDDTINDTNEKLTALDGIAEYAKAPVTIVKDNVTSIPNYGTAFAPYFMSLSLWVGALILFVGVYLDTEGKFKILSRASEHKVARSFIYLIIGFIQAFALAFTIKYALGLKIDNALLYYASCCLVSIVFISIVQFLMVHLKDVGKLLSIVLLILQLTSCGGTFPMETVPKFFNDLFPFMPMTYSVALFKESITNANTDHVLYNGGILFAILLIFMALTILFSVIKMKRADKVVSFTETERVY